MVRPQHAHQRSLKDHLCRGRVMSEWRSSDMECPPVVLEEAVHVRLAEDVNR
jgi:hypothetical protein